MWDVQTEDITSQVVKATNERYVFGNSLHRFAVGAQTVG